MKIEIYLMKAGVDKHRPSRRSSKHRPSDSASKQGMLYIFRLRGKEGGGTGREKREKRGGRKKERGGDGEERERGGGVETRQREGWGDREKEKQTDTDMN